MILIISHPEIPVAVFLQADKVSLRNYEVIKVDRKNFISYLMEKNKRQSSTTLPPIPYFLFFSLFAYRMMYQFTHFMDSCFTAPFRLRFLSFFLTSSKALARISMIGSMVQKQLMEFMSKYRRQLFERYQSR